MQRWNPDHGGLEGESALVHRWLALTLGEILAIVSLSGSLLLFQEHFFRWAREPGGLATGVRRSAGRAAHRQSAGDDRYRPFDGLRRVIHAQHTMEGDLGKALLAAMDIGALIMLPLGPYLWWPRRSKVLQKLSQARSAEVPVIQ
ncbi:MAG: hypothetical protein ACREXP_19815 [Steroidobacteraceae bacterium]